MNCYGFRMRIRGSVFNVSSINLKGKLLYSVQLANDDAKYKISLSGCDSNQLAKCFFAEKVEIECSETDGEIIDNIQIFVITFVNIY